MNAKLVLLTFFAALAPLARAEEPRTEFDASRAASGWNTDPKHWDQVLRERTDTPALRIGKSDFAISGPIIEGLRPRSASSDRNLGQKLLGLPVVRLFVPQRMPAAPGGGGRYFAWGESRRPWAAIAVGAAPERALNLMKHELQNSLISISH